MLRLGLPVALIVIILDQLSKWWIVEKVFRPEGVLETPFFTPFRIQLLPVFDLVMAWNRGVSFGVFNQAVGGRWILTALSLVIAAGLLVWMYRARSWLLGVALGLIVGGALGNVIDRLKWGAVADFLDFHVGLWHWPAFNVADSAITVGAIILALDSLFAGRRSSKK